MAEEVSKVGLQDIPPFAEPLARDLLAIGIRRGLVSIEGPTLPRNDLPLYYHWKNYENDGYQHQVESQVFQEAARIQKRIDKDGSISPTSRSLLSLLTFRIMYAQAYALDNALPILRNVHLDIARFNPYQAIHSQSLNRIRITCTDPDSPDMSITFNTTLFHLASEYRLLTGGRMNSKEIYILLRKAQLKGVNNPEDEETEQEYYFRAARESKILDRFAIREASDGQKQQLHDAKYFIVRSLLEARARQLSEHQEQTIFLAKGLGMQFGKPFLEEDIFEIRVANPKRNNTYTTFRFLPPTRTTRYTPTQRKNLTKVLDDFPPDGTYMREDRYQK